MNIRQFVGRLKLQWRRKNHIVGWNMTPEAVIAFFMRQGKTVLSFYGYSGLGYEDENAMLEVARNVLYGYSSEITLVNIGVTSVGIGAIYPLAKSMGFETAGIVTSLALEYPEGISDTVDHVCFVLDQRWGGNLPNSDELSPTSKAMVECSDILVGIGGGGISEAEMLAGKAQGKPVHFYPAEMNHARAVNYAKRMGMPPPESFWGSNGYVFRK
jgi:hypothetical protein